MRGFPLAGISGSGLGAVCEAAGCAAVDIDDSSLGRYRNGVRGSANPHRADKGMREFVTGGLLAA